MEFLKQNWLKLSSIVLVSIAVRVVLLQVLPLRNSGTFELPLSAFAERIGMIPAAAIVMTASYLTIATVLLVSQEHLAGNRFERWIRCSLPFSLLWMVAVLETVASLGKPFWPELMIGLTDILPLLVMGTLVSGWGSSKAPRRAVSDLQASLTDIFTIAGICFLGRYFLYAILPVNSGYASQASATFFWTLAFGLAIGQAYYLLSPGLKGAQPITRALWYGGIAFGLYWTLNNAFMPVVFDISFVKLDPPILNYVYRALGDITSVVFGVWMVETRRTEIGRVRPA